MIAFLALLVAFVCFILASFGVGARFNLVAIGLALVTLSMLVGAGEVVAF